MSDEFTEIAEEIFKLVGPRENILSMKNYRSSLKLNLKDKKKVDVGVLKRIEGVYGIIETQKQLQIIIVHRNSEDIIDEFFRVARIKDKLWKFSGEKKSYSEIKQNNLRPFKELFKKVSSIFIE